MCIKPYVLNNLKDCLQLYTLLIVRITWELSKYKMFKLCIVFSQLNVLLFVGMVNLYDTINILHSWRGYN